MILLQQNVEQLYYSAGTVLSDDSDVDGDSLTVSELLLQTVEVLLQWNFTNSHSVGSAVTGYYGQLTLDSDGTYSYVANQSNANALDSGESYRCIYLYSF